MHKFIKGKGANNLLAAEQRTGKCSNCMDKKLVGLVYNIKRRKTVAIQLKCTMHNYGGLIKVFLLCIVNMQIDKVNYLVTYTFHFA